MQMEIDVEEINPSRRYGWKTERLIMLQSQRVFMSGLFDTKGWRWLQLAVFIQSLLVPRFEPIFLSSVLTE